MRGKTLDKSFNTHHTSKKGAGYQLLPEPGGEGLFSFNVLIFYLLEPHLALLRRPKGTFRAGGPTEATCSLQVDRKSTQSAPTAAYSSRFVVGCSPPPPPEEITRLSRQNQELAEPTDLYVRTAQWRCTASMYGSARGLHKSGVRLRRPAVRRCARAESGTCRSVPAALFFVCMVPS